MRKKKIPHILEKILCYRHNSGIRDEKEIQKEKIRFKHSEMRGKYQARKE